MLPEKGESLKLMWVPAHTEIERNEAADEAAKDALNEDILPGTKATKMDWKRWLKNAARRILENEWMTSENAMVQVKPNMKKIKRYSKSFTSQSSWGVETENGLHQNSSGIQTGQQSSTRVPIMSENTFSLPFLWECRSFESQTKRRINMDD
jgi:hypothetical protein